MLLLLDHGAKVDGLKTKYRTASLHSSALHCFTDVVAMLLHRWANVSTDDECSDTSPAPSCSQRT
jgi:hypothetical protein